jgi:hypothetical protein
LGSWVRAAVVAILGVVVLTAPVWLAPARPFVAPLQAGLGGPDPPPPTEAPPARPTPTPTPTPSPTPTPQVSTPEPQTESPSTPDTQQTTPDQPSAAELARRAAARAEARARARERLRRQRAAAALARREREARAARRRREAAFQAVAKDVKRSGAVVAGVTAAAEAADPGSVTSSGGGNGWGRIGFLLFLVLSVASGLAAAFPYAVRAHRASAAAGATARSHRMDVVIGLTRSHRAELVALSVGALLLGLLLLGMS